MIKLNICHVSKELVALYTAKNEKEILATIRSYKAFFGVTSGEYIAQVHYDENDIRDVPNRLKYFDKYFGKRFRKVKEWITIYTLNGIRIKDEFKDSSGFYYQIDHFAEKLNTLSSLRYLYCSFDDTYYLSRPSLNSFDMTENQVKPINENSSINNWKYGFFDNGCPFYYFRAVYDYEVTKELLEFYNNMDNYI